MSLLSPYRQAGEVKAAKVYPKAITADERYRLIRTADTVFLIEGLTEQVDAMGSKTLCWKTFATIDVKADQDGDRMRRALHGIGRDGLDMEFAFWLCSQLARVCS